MVFSRLLELASHYLLDRLFESITTGFALQDFASICSRNIILQRIDRGISQAGETLNVCVPTSMHPFPTPTFKLCTCRTQAKAHEISQVGSAEAEAILSKGEAEAKVWRGEAASVFSRDSSVQWI